MPKVRISVELSQEHFRRLEREARRRRVEVERLVEQCVNSLVREDEAEVEAGTDIEIVPS